MKQSFQIANVFGIPIEINYTWIVIFLLITWSLAVGFYPFMLPNFSERVYWASAIISTLLLFFSLLLHELAHSIVAINNGVPIKKISLFIFGGVAQMAKDPDDPVSELKISIAGPICSLVIAMLCFLIVFFLPEKRIAKIFSSILIYTAFVNMAIVFFNLIPGFPLDGGRIFRAILWIISKNLRQATRVATYFGKGFSFLVMMIGILFLYKQQYLNGFWLLVLGFFLHEAAEMSYQQLILKKALVGVPVKEIMSTDIITIDAGLTLDKVVNDYFFKYKHMGFPVVENGILKGIITLRDIKEFQQKDWPSTKAYQAMTPVKQDLIVSSNLDCLEALLQVTKSGLGRLLVVDNGKLSGIITQRSLLKMFEIKTNLCA